MIELPEAAVITEQLNETSTIAPAVKSNNGVVDRCNEDVVFSAF
mgnify:CR=1 FL=1